MIAYLHTRAWAYTTASFLILCSLVGLGGSASAQSSLRTDQILTQKLQQLTVGFEGDVGIYVEHLGKKRTVAIHADSLFPTASMIKIPILCGVFEKLHKGELRYNQVLTYRDSLHYDDGIVGSLKDSTQIPITYVMMLMETVSDNTGSLWLQSLAGGGEQINAWLEREGFRHIRVNSRTPGREQARTQYGWGQTSPREMAQLLVRMRRGELISPNVSERMYRYLGRQFWDGEGLSQLPPTVKVAAKNGAVNRAKSEVVLVHAPHGDYVYCVTTKNQKDERWERDNAGYVLLRKIARTIWEHYEPKNGWTPPSGYEKWW